MLEKLALAENELDLVREQAIIALGNLGEIAFPVLENLALDEDKDSSVRGQAILALGNLGKIDPHLLKERVLPLLVRLAEDKDSSVREKAIVVLDLVLDKIKGRLKSESKLWLLATKKPLFATP